MKRYNPILNNKIISRVKDHIFDQETEEWMEPFGDMIESKDGKYVKLEDVEAMLETIGCFPAALAHNGVGIARMKLAELRGEL